MALIPKDGDLIKEVINKFNCEFEIRAQNETKFSGTASIIDSCILLPHWHYNDYTNKNTLLNHMKSEIDQYTKDPSFRHPKKLLSGEKCKRCGRTAGDREIFIL